MLYKLLAAAAMMPGSYAVLRCVSMVVPMEHSRRMACMGTLLQVSIWLINNLLLARPTVLLDLLANFICLGLVCCFVSRDQYIRSVFTVVIMEICQIIGTFITISVAVFLLGMDPLRVTVPGDYLHLILCLVTSCVTIPIAYCAGWVLGRVLPNFRLNLNYLWFLSIPVSQLILFNLALRPAFNIESYGGFPMALLVCVPLSITADVACVVVYRKLKNLEYLQFTVEQAEKAIDDQTSHYNQLQAQILTVNQIRHDLNNQLQTARYLLQQGDTEQAFRQLDQLETVVQNRVGPKYSDNPVVDAVISVKAEECSRQGIRLEASLVLPRELKIENAHLCSLFSNLLDNSLQGVLEAETPEKVIRLRSDVQGEYLTVVCSNPAIQPRKKKSRDVLRLHGLGMEILESLARKYEGHMDSEWKDNAYTTRISLKNPK